MLSTQREKQRAIKEKAVSRLAEAIKKETGLLKQELANFENEKKKREVFEDKLKGKLTWKSFEGYPQAKKSDADLTVWPPDDYFTALDDAALSKLGLSYLHFQSGTNVESLTMQLNDGSLMQHPQKNNFTTKVNKELST